MEISITVTGATPEEVAAGLQKLAGGAVALPPAGPGPTPTPTPIPTPGPTPAPVEYFPASPLDAPFPSPEDSTTGVLDGKIGGKPYLRNSRGTVYRFDVDAQGNPIAVTGQWGTGFRWTMNGQPNPAGTMAHSMIMRQGEVYLDMVGAAWAVFKIDSLMAPTTKLALPPSSTGTPAAPPTMPPDPVAAAIAPGSSGKTILAGPTQAITTLAGALAAAQDGDTIKLDPGLYIESVLVNKAVVIDGGGTLAAGGTRDALYTPGAVIDASSIGHLVQSKAALVLMTDCVVRGLEIRGAGSAEALAGMTSAIRNGAGGRFVVEHCYLHHNQTGIGGGAQPCLWQVRSTLLVDNGIGDSQAHNVYLSTGDVRAAFENVTSIVGAVAPNPVYPAGKTGGGHALKLRVNSIRVSDCFLSSWDGSPIDIPDGTTEPFVIEKTILDKPAAAANHRLLSYAVESQSLGTVGGSLIDCALIGACPNPFVAVNAGTVALIDCTKQGAITKSGPGAVTGL